MRTRIPLARPIAPAGPKPRGRPRPRGIGPGEVLVVIAVLGVVALLLMLGLTRSREVARSASCARNLRQIGIALELYEQATRQLPHVPPLVDGGDGRGRGPLALMLDQFGVPSLAVLDPQAAPPSNDALEPAIEGYLPGFVCPSDPIATSRTFPAPVNYRANAGSRTDGRLGQNAQRDAAQSDPQLGSRHLASQVGPGGQRQAGPPGPTLSPSL